MSNLKTKKEEGLLAKINTPFADSKKSRFNLLIAKRDAKTLSLTEYEELLALTEDFEKYELRRLQLLAQLADLRKISLPEVISFYELFPSANS